jgi:hypothetical protein
VFLTFADLPACRAVLVAEDHAVRDKRAFAPRQGFGEQSLDAREVEQSMGTGRRIWRILAFVFPNER